MQGINDPDIILADESPDMLEPTPQSHKEETTEENTEAVLSPQVEQERYWNDFLKHLEASDEQNDKSERLVCRLDRDLADSLDDCVIYNRSRSDMVNAIVRSFSMPTCRSWPSFAGKRNHCLPTSISKPMRKRRTNWTEQKIALLVQLYPIETTPHTAQVLDMSERSVKMKARQLGLKKMEKTRWLERADYIRNHFGHRSFAEIGKDLGVSREYVRRIAANMGLKRTPSEDFNLFSRIHTDIMRRERRRVIFGLSPITRIKVVSNRARVRLRSWLRSQGYVAGEEYGILYYPDHIRRIKESEMRGAKLGFRFLPFPVEATVVLSNLL